MTVGSLLRQIKARKQEGVFMIFVNHEN